VLASARHGNKLRTGHLAGNRFVIVLRDLACPVGEALARAHAKVAVLAREGMPNFYGEQRMGHSGSTLAAGWALAAGLDGRVTVQTTDGVAHQIPLRDRALRRLAASALQSELFNRVVAARLEAGTLRRVLPGDLCRKTDSGGSFVTDDPAREQERLERGEIELTGPMWGPKMMRPAGEAADVEAAALAQMGLDEAAFQRLGALAQGTRRALQVRPGELACAADDASLRLRFALPAGSFATVLLHELCGPGGADDGPSEDADSEVACA
jgi:tRNA pseudouridine13 synthase